MESFTESYNACSFFLLKQAPTIPLFHEWNMDACYRGTSGNQAACLRCLSLESPYAFPLQGKEMRICKTGQCGSLKIPVAVAGWRRDHQEPRIGSGKILRLM